MNASAATLASDRAGLSQALSASQRQQWDRDGYLILPRFFNDDIVDSINVLVDSLKDPQTRPPGLAKRLVVDLLTGPLADQRLRLAQVPADALVGPVKFNDLYLESDIVRGCSLHPRLVPILTELLDGEPAICNSLNFIQGSQQTGHIDTWFMPPPVANKMVITSICLEDVHPDAGPLFYWPGSQQIPPYMFWAGRIKAINAELPKCMDYVNGAVKERGLTRQTFLGRKGDVFIWAAQLLHGGTPINDITRTRRSLVVHYWRAQDLPSYKLGRCGPGAYYIGRDHQPIPSSPPWEKLAGRVRHNVRWGFKRVGDMVGRRQ
jgi:phytanoyl-CoA hydroxylase